MKVSKVTPKIASLFLLSLLVAAFGIAAVVDDSGQIYSKLQKAFYLSPDEAVFIRPGLQLTIIDVTIPADRRPVATFRITDDQGLPLDRTGALTPGSVSTSFILAYLPPAPDGRVPQYVDYSTSKASSDVTGITTYQASTDRGGTYTDLGDGVYTYKFGTVLPADYPTDRTNTLGIYSTRDLTEFGLSLYVANQTHNFVPDGSPVTVIRDIVEVQACDGCHYDLLAHGETGRHEVKICILCHTPQTIDPDTGNTVDLKVMIHKIHDGANLPSVQAGVPYEIIGHGGSVHDFSDVVFPQDIRNCVVCHKDTPQVNAWKLFPSIAACGSCHDNVNFATGENHPGGPQENDSQCSSCHAPVETFEYDASVPGAHTVPYESTQLIHPTFELLSITNTDPGESPTIQFRVTDKNGDLIPPSQMASFSAIVGGPTIHYEQYFRASLTGTSYDPDGVATYTFSDKIPSNATGTYALEMEGYVNTDIIENGNPDRVTSYRDAADNLVHYFAVTGDVVVPRRTVVALDNCDKCHGKLQLHGNNRNRIEACVICHNPTAVDTEYRPEDQYPPTSIDFPVLVHRIHTGVNLQMPYIVYGYHSSVNNFSDVLYPGDRRVCTQCHEDETFTLPLPPGRIDSVTPRYYFSPSPPITEACTACHDSLSTAAHAYSNIVDLGEAYPLAEACDTCHKEGAAFAVTEVHAR